LRVAPSAYLPTNAARRGLFKRLLHPGRTASLVPCRPPGARAEADFIDLCSRCEACLRACPSQIIVRGDGGFPELNFSAAGCTGCGDCISACQPQALQPGAPAWPMGQVSVSGDCLANQGVTCQACKDACDLQAIEFPITLTTPQPVFNPDVCVACGECVSVCPVNSLFINPLETSAAGSNR